MDGNILLWIQDHFRWEGMNWFWKGITSLGNGGWFWIVLCILMVVFAKISGEKCSIKNENCSRAVIGRAGWYGLLSMGAGALITNVCLKNLVARPRPYEVVEGLVPLIGKPTDRKMWCMFQSMSGRCDRLRSERRDRNRKIRRNRRCHRI